MLFRDVRDPGQPFPGPAPPGHSAEISSFLRGTIMLRKSISRRQSSGRIRSMGQAERPTCPKCGAHLILALPPGGKGQRTFQCFDCERPDPLESASVLGWLDGELGSPDIQASDD
jgi:hypothetical protein